MKVVLDSDVKGVGRKHELKEVSAGYARNFLFPNKLARQATPTIEKEIEKAREISAAQEANLQKHLRELADKIASRSLVFEVKIDDKGSVFGSVTKEMIISGMRDSKLITKEHVYPRLDRPLKGLGEHVIEIDLKKGIQTKLKVILKTRI